ncbi:unnamed protein product [Agarophyton chilense]
MAYGQQPYDANNGPGFGGPAYGANPGYGYAPPANNPQPQPYNSYSQPAAGYMPASQTNNDDSSFASETLQPLTVKQLLNAAPDPSDPSKLTVNSATLTQLTLVARIVAADVQVTTITLTVDDCTATIQGTYVLPVEDEMAPNEISLQKRAWIKTGAWLRLVAAPYVQPASRSLTVYRVRRVTDFNEILYHRLQVVQTLLAQTRQAVPGANSASAVPSAYHATVPVAYQPENSNAHAADDDLAMNPLQRVVYDYVRSRKDNVQRGVTVDEVTRHAAAAHGATAPTVKAILDGFASDGHMYTTIDEHHYAFCRL